MTITVTNKTQAPIIFGSQTIPGTQSAIVTGISIAQLDAKKAAGLIDWVSDGAIDSYGGPFNRTYSATAIITPAALATDLVTIMGSSTATINVTRIYMQGSQTTSGLTDVRLERRSSANAGGTSSTVALVQHDTSDPAPTALITAYSVNPTTIGTVVGVFRRALFSMTNITATINSIAAWTFGDSAKAIVLRGTSQYLALTMNGSTTLAAGQIFVTIEWFEA